MEKGEIELLMTEDAKYFLASLEDDVINKILYNIDRVLKGEKNQTLFKKLDKTDIWEFRTLFRKNSYRLFAFWDTTDETLIIATHGIIKKTQKTPLKEIAKAERIRKRYFEQKKK